MTLTGKAKEDFIKWCNTSSISYIDILGLETYLNALIIEFFDSVGIYINIEYYHKRWYLYLIPKTGIGNYLIDRNEFYSRQEATTQAILKANDIYNETKTQKMHNL